MYGLYDSAEAAAQKAHDACFLPALVAVERPIFNARLFKSGEISACYYLSGASGKAKPPVRSGPVVTTGFSQKSRTKIRRAVENSSQSLVSFLTLTFSPWDLSPWQVRRYQSRVPGLSVLTSVALRCFGRRGRSARSFCLVPRASLKRRKGFVISFPLPNPEQSEFKTVHYSVNLILPVVRQDYAKYRLTNLRSALTMKVNRQIACKLKELPEDQHETYKLANKFRLVWTAELQENGNIHFHALTNKYWAKKYLAKVWPYGQTNIKQLKDAAHAAQYMVKYLSKDEDTSIEGNRYNISANLRKEATPMIYGLQDTDAIEARKALQLMKKLIEDRGGHVIDSGFGCNIPKPTRSLQYLDKKTGTRKRTKACGRSPGDGAFNIHDGFMNTFFPVRAAFLDSGGVPF
jgi:hypothetical protein